MKKNIKKKDVLFIEGKKIYLRPIKKSDINNGWLRWINDPELRYNLLGVFPVSEKDLTSYFEAQKLPHSVMFAICDKKSNKYIGNIRLTSIDFINKNCRFGRLIGEQKFRNKGVGTEALILALRYGFETLGMNKMSTLVLAKNTASIKSNLRVGLKKEGLHKKSIFKKGKFFDEIFFSILANDFYKKYGSKN
tara:strand:+ start:45 stop:620 length:576 start_codon:yes stop_codon:yes gene_type:complete